MASLAMIATAIHKSIPFPIKKISAVEISSLSAMGSISLPNSVICFFFLAKYPSRKSEIESIPKMNAAKMFLYGIFTKRMTANKGIKATLMIVILLGMLNLNFIIQKLFKSIFKNFHYARVSCGICIEMLLFDAPGLFRKHGSRNG